MGIRSIKHWSVLTAMLVIAVAVESSLGQAPLGELRIVRPPDDPLEVSGLVATPSDGPVDAMDSEPRRPLINAYPPSDTSLANNSQAQFILSQQIGAGDFCDTCGCGGENRCGTGCPHPWRTGHGVCDDWCVGPHWDVQLDGMILNRKDLDVAGLENLWGGVNSRIEQFHYEAGARGYVSGYSGTGYGIQLGYVGVDHWQSSGQFVLPVSGPREFVYTSGIHSGELNFLPDVNSVWRLLLGVRYVELTEFFVNSDSNGGDKEWSTVKNKMIGFQIGARRDLWEYDDRWFIDALVNGGVYRNRITRFDQVGSIAIGPTSSTRTEDNETAFLGEAAITAVYHLNRCVALRGGYQILYVDGITTADRAMIGPGMDVRSLFYHGAHVGVEYRR